MARPERRPPPPRGAMTAERGGGGEEEAEEGRGAVLWLWLWLWCFVLCGGLLVSSATPLVSTSASISPFEGSLVAPPLTSLGVFSAS